MRVRTLTLQAIRGGQLDGVLAFHVGLSKDSPQLSASDLIDKILAHPCGRIKMVMVTGDLAGEDSDVMYAFFTALKGLGYNCGIECGGDIFPPWFGLASHVRVIISPDTVWLRFPCSEIRLAISSPADPEPALPATPPPCLVYAENVKDAITFIKKAKNGWALLTGTKSPYTEIIYAGAKDREISLRMSDDEPKAT